MTGAAGAARSPIRVVSRALGAVEVDPEAAFTACEPLAGFPDCASYALVDHPRADGSPSPSVHWLQALEPPHHAFVVADPWSAFPDYAPEISDADAARLDLGGFEDARVLAVLTMPRGPGEVTANLRAPIVVNVARRLVKQVVLLNDEYHTRHPVGGAT